MYFTKFQYKIILVFTKFRLFLLKFSQNSDYFEVKFHKIPEK